MVESQFGRKLFVFITAAAFFAFIDYAFAQSRAWELLDDLDTEEEEVAPQQKPLKQEAETVSLKKKMLNIQLKAGMDAGEVARRFGKPDEKQGRAKAGTESWFYGESVIYFSNSKVVAWSDRGELSMRSRLKSKQSKTGFAQDGWKSAWRREKHITSTEVLDDLVSGKE